MSDSLNEAVKYIKRAKRLVVFTGAGMSRDSGIETFRGSNGVWSGILGNILLLYGGTPLGWSLTPAWTWSGFISRFYIPIAQAKPHQGHFALVKIRNHLFGDDPSGRRISPMSIITMNVDGLHQSSGFPDKDVFEVHGSVRKFRCCRCAQPMVIDDPTAPVSLCSINNCRGHPRPDVTLFHESLPINEWSKAMKAVNSVREGDVILVIGTSSVVYPAASIPSIAKSKGATVIEINPSDDSPLHNLNDIYIKGGAEEVLSKLALEIIEMKYS